MKKKEEQVVLVDSEDRALGLKNKQGAHVEGLLHRAISIFVFNDKNELMLQQRASHKYHSRLLWANICCSHPRQGEAVSEAAHRRLNEEMGFDCPLEERFHFIYKADLNNGLIEHEFDHVFLGRYEGLPKINPEEVADWRWINLEELMLNIEPDSEQYAVWLRIIIEQHAAKLKL
ncbi:MAG: isopentenyl-diphosphate Delta-isomerase [Flavobacteriales bacterium Tduv]